MEKFITKISFDNAQIYDGYQEPNYLPYVEVTVPGRHVDTPIGRFYCLEPGKQDGKAFALLFKAAPLLLSALIKSVQLEEWARKRFGVEDIKYPDWYHEAKAAIAAAGVVVEESNEETAEK